MVNPRHHAPQVQSVGKPGTPLKNVQVKYKKWHKGVRRCSMFNPVVRCNLLGHRYSERCVVAEPVPSFRKPKCLCQNEYHCDYQRFTYRLVLKTRVNIYSIYFHFYTRNLFVLHKECCRNQGQVVGSCFVFFDASLNNLLYNLSSCWQFEIPWRSCNVSIIICLLFTKK